MTFTLHIETLYGISAIEYMHITDILKVLEGETSATFIDENWLPLTSGQSVAFGHKHFSIAGLPRKSEPVYTPAATKFPVCTDADCVVDALLAHSTDQCDKVPRRRTSTPQTSEKAIPKQGPSSSDGTSARTVDKA